MREARAASLLRDYLYTGKRATWKWDELSKASCNNILLPAKFYFLRFHNYPKNATSQYQVFTFVFLLRHFSFKSPQKFIKELELNYHVTNYATSGYILKEF